MMTMLDDRPGTTVPQRRRPANILLVEDNPLDARSTLRAARKLELTESLEVVTHGQAALDRLRAHVPDADRVDLMLLDLNLPGKDGHDILNEIRSDPSLRSLPVVVLTTSSDRADVDSAYRQGANAYVTKPTGLDGWLRVMASIREFWLCLAVLPGTVS
jgi:two-component system, chemotaxis family, response regulator Rcp1